MVKVPRAKALGVGLGVVVLLAVGGTILWHHRQLSPRVQVQEVTLSTGSPEEGPVEIDKYPSSPQSTEPQKLVIPSISVDALLQRVGVDQYSQIAVPTNVMLAGWFTHSIIPGEKGLSIIDGHVNGRTRAGVFANLAKVKIGDAVTIELGNGEKRSFTTTNVMTIPTSEASNLLFSQDPKVKSQLNLITCDGVYDSKTNDFTERTIVEAKLD